MKSSARLLAVALVIGSSGACSTSESYSETEGETESGPEVLERLEAPYAFLPRQADGAPGVLALLDAEVRDHGRGTLLLEGNSISVREGALEAVTFESGADGLLRPIGPHQPAERDLPPELLTDFEGALAVDVRLDAVQLEGYERAILIGDKTLALEGPLVVDAHALVWLDPHSGIELFGGEDDDEVAAASQPRVFSPRGHATAPSKEPGLAQIVVAAAEVGEPCTASEECTGDLVCVTDPSAPQGVDVFVCAAECIPDDNVSGSPGCVDDDACCNDAAVCSDEGVCVPIGGGGEGGGSSGGGSQEGGCNEGCGDNDNDGVINAWDKKPDESCSADQDEDGCKDSCDANDADASDGCGGEGGFCRSTRLGRPNSLFWGLVLLVAIRGRGKRRPRPAPPAP